MGDNFNAPGYPGITPKWSPGPKTAVGTALSEKSNVWFSVGHGILNEVFYPRVDKPAIRDMGFLISDGQNYFSEERTDTRSEVTWLAQGVPAFKIVNTAKDGKYRISKLVITDSNRDCLLQHTSFEILDGSNIDDYHLYVLLAPHLANCGGENTAWVDKTNKRTILLAERVDCALALCCSSQFITSSAGYVGYSDAWQDVSINKIMTQEYLRAENGNVALGAEIDLKAKQDFVLSLGFGADADQAKTNALASLNEPFEQIQQDYISAWLVWHKKRKSDIELDDLAFKSLAVLQTHQSKNPSGGIIAGLSSPWGYARSDDNPIGYHIVWTRDMVESAGGLLAAGQFEDIRNIIGYLQYTQRDDGHWPQNMWVDGSPYWNGIQMDETALPILLVNMARREDAIDDKDVLDFWQMIKKAAGYIVRNGPVTQQDRWEEDPGYTPFTVSAEIAALLAAADFADLNKEPGIAKYLRDTADNWYEALDRWMYSRDSEWARKYNIDGYYERIATIDSNSVSRFQNTVQIKNVPSDLATLKATHLISPDALALVRFGLRAANDLRITNTVQMIDDILKIETPFGLTWHRYNNDGYGEHQDGSAFDGTGIGRGWPLLSGERAHYELALGNFGQADKLRQDMANFACQSGLIPEQVWDNQPIVEYELELGRPTGSAMPLAWAHAEYIKLVRSLKDGRIFDQPHQTVKRYLVDKTIANYRSWRFNHKIRTISTGKILRVEVLTPAKVRWTVNDWRTSNNDATQDSGLGVYFCDLDTSQLPAGTNILFTFYWLYANRWEGVDFKVYIES